LNRKRRVRGQFQTKRGDGGERLSAGRGGQKRDSIGKFNSRRLPSEGGKAVRGKNFRRQKKGISTWGGN